MLKRFAILIGISLATSACGGLGSSGCGDEAAREALRNLMDSAIEDSVREKLDADGNLGSFDRATLTSILKKGKMELSSVRTTRDDPDSSRQFCTATIKLSYPMTVIDVIEDARRDAQLEGRKQIANRAGLRVSPTGLEDDLEYSVQPTDDGSETVAETDAASALTDTLGELFATYLLSDEIRSAKIEQDQIASQAKAEAAAAEREQQEIMAESEAAAVEYAKASAAEAAAANKIAAQELAAVWQAIPADTRKRLAPMQTAWNQKTTARCKVEAAGSSSSRDEMRAAQLACETRALNARSNELERFAVYSDAGEDETYD